MRPLFQVNAQLLPVPVLQGMPLPGRPVCQRIVRECPGRDFPVHRDVRKHREVGLVALPVVQRDPVPPVLRDLRLPGDPVPCGLKGVRINRIQPGMLHLIGFDRRVIFHDTVDGGAVRTEEFLALDRNQCTALRRLLRRGFRDLRCGAECNIPQQECSFRHGQCQFMGTGGQFQQQRF